MIEPYLAILSGGGSLHDILRAEGSDVGWRATVSRAASMARGDQGAAAGRAATPGAGAMRTGAAMAAGLGFAREFVSTIGDAVVLHPPAPTVAPRHGRTIGRMDWPQLMGLFNPAGLPVTQVPLAGSPACHSAYRSLPAQAGTAHVSIRRAGAGTRLRRMGPPRLVDADGP